MQRKTIRQSGTLIPVFLTSIVSGMNYAWFAANYKHLCGPNAEISLSDNECSVLASMVHFGRMLAPALMMIVGRNIGRKPVMITANAIMVVANGMLLVTNYAIVFHISRVLAGFSIGLGDCVSIIYVGEISGRRVRGIFCALTMTNFLGGMLIEYMLTAFLSYVYSGIVLFLIAAATFLSCLVQIESPYYFVSSERHERALKTISWLLDLDEKQSYGRFVEIKENIDETKNLKFFELIKTPAVYKSYLIVNSFGIVSSIVGTTISTNVNLIVPSSNLLSADKFAVLFTTAATAAVTLSAVFIHRFGRRILLIWSFALETILCAAIAALFYVNEKSFATIPQFPWIIFFFITVSYFIFMLGAHSTIITLRSELYPQNFKTIANNSGILFNACTNFISTFSFMHAMRAGAMYVNFIIFATASLVGVFITYFALPETKGKTLVEIQKILEKK